MMKQEWQRVLLVRYGEIHLKGLNRPYFERELKRAIEQALSMYAVQVKRAQSRIYVYGLLEEQMEDAIARMQRVLGVHSVSAAVAVPKEWEEIEQAACMLMQGVVQEGQSFKVEARRADKSFFMRSDELNRKLGERLLMAFPGLRVNVHTPDIRVGVEVRESCFLYAGETMCAGGMPVGCNGRATLLLSGGIDSPVAGFMIARRGVSIHAVHFYSYPYTSERARDKVVELSRILARYTGEIRLHLVPFTEIQLAIYENCPKSETTVLMRRQMMRIAELVAREEKSKALVTGESLGQVASQTMESMLVTEDAVELPVYRPLIGLDKNEIIARANAIETYETSIQPYEDCCTVFVPKHPVTRPRLKDIQLSEQKVNFTEMLQRAMDEREIILALPL